MYPGILECMAIRVAQNFCSFGRWLWWPQKLPDRGVFGFKKE
jgi:hypothetical protein